jgi:hypothetical protein
MPISLRNVASHQRSLNKIDTTKSISSKPNKTLMFRLDSRTHQPAGAKRLFEIPAGIMRVSCHTHSSNVICQPENPCVSTRYFGFGVIVYSNPSFGIYTVGQSVAPFLSASFAHFYRFPHKCSRPHRWRSSADATSRFRSPSHGLPTR